MAKLDLDRFCDDLQSCYGKHNSYGTPQCLTLSLLQGGYRQVKCAGFLVAAAKAQGVSLSNGTNTLWRTALSESGYITDGKPSNPYPHRTNGLKSFALQRGMVVFKWSPTGCSNPKHEKDGQGNYQHIGVVLSANPLRIIHCSSEFDGITIDTKIGKWAAWGWLNCSDRIVQPKPIEQTTEKVGDNTMAYNAKAKCDCKVRSSNTTDSNQVGSLKCGKSVNIIGELDGWYKIERPDGWVRCDLLSVLKNVQIMPVDPEIPTDDYVTRAEFNAALERIRQLENMMDMGDVEK